MRERETDIMLSVLDMCKIPYTPPSSLPRSHLLHLLFPALISSIFSSPLSSPPSSLPTLTCSIFLLPLQEFRRLGCSKHLLPWQRWCCELWWAKNCWLVWHLQAWRLQLLLVATITSGAPPHTHTHTHTHTGRYEQPPYDQGTIRSTYHVRSCDVFRLKQVHCMSTLTDGNDTTWLASWTV